MEKAQIRGTKAPVGFGDDGFDVEQGWLHGGGVGPQIFLGCSGTALELMTNLEHLLGRTPPSPRDTRRLLLKTRAKCRGEGL